MMNPSKYFLRAVLLVLIAAASPGTTLIAQQTVGPNGYEQSLLPVPQRVQLGGSTFTLDNTWRLDEASGAGNSAAKESLLAGLAEKGLKLAAGATAGTRTIKLVVKRGAVSIGSTTDTSRVELEKQAYRLVLALGNITITANAPQGLFYGVQTLLQLVRSQPAAVQLPTGEITDWPNLNTRMIYWDDAHHLEKMDAFKRILLQCAYYKINAFALKLEGHFQFKSAPAIVEPYALSPAEYQELTDYAAKYFVDLVPYLDAPAHVAFILKHPEYKDLRLFPNNNYQFSVTNPGTQKLLKGMFGDLLQANKGSRFVLFSTDEAYYTGKGGDEVAAAKALGGNGKLLAKFIKEMADELHRQGRTVLFWGEYPLNPDDIPGLPAHLVNGVYSKSLAPYTKKNGMRQFIYTSTQGTEPLFPNYYPWLVDSSAATISDRSANRVAGMLKDINGAINDKISTFMGTIVAAWADAGLHPETFWLGYATGSAAGWNPVNVTAENLSSRFFRSFYGPRQQDMLRIYQLLSSQAFFFDQSWDEIDSDLRSPILGSHLEIFKTPEPAKDQTIPMLPVPDAATLAVTNQWDTANVRRMASVRQASKDNDELVGLLRTATAQAGDKAYNIEVLTSVALLCRQNLAMLRQLQDASTLLQRAGQTAGTNKAAALGLIDSALHRVSVVKKERAETLALVERTWFKDWHPLVAEANGRKYFHAVDNIKDHQPVRTIDLSYLVYRQLHYPLDKWVAQVTAVREQFAGR